MSPTDRSVALRRTAEMAAVFMIGDGLLGLLQPVRHVDLWRSRIAPVNALVRPFAGRPDRRRIYGALQLAAGLVLAARLFPPHDNVPHVGKVSRSSAD